MVYLMLFTLLPAPSVKLNLKVGGKWNFLATVFFSFLKLVLGFQYISCKKVIHLLAKTWTVISNNKVLQALFLGTISHKFMCVGEATLVSKAWRGERTFQIINAHNKCAPL